MRRLGATLGDGISQHVMDTENTMTPCHTALRERPGPFCHHLSDDHCLMIGDSSQLAGSVSLAGSLLAPVAGSGG